MIFDLICDKSVILTNLIFTESNEIWHAYFPWSGVHAHKISEKMRSTKKRSGQCTPENEPVAHACATTLTVQFGFSILLYN